MWVERLPYRVGATLANMTCDSRSAVNVRALTLRITFDFCWIGNNFVDSKIEGLPIENIDVLSSKSISTKLLPT